MMTVSDKSANIDFSEREYEALLFLTADKIGEMKSKLKDCDRHKYIEMCQLNAKLESILTMINYEKRQKEEQKVLEDVEECAYRAW